MARIVPGGYTGYTEITTWLTLRYAVVKSVIFALPTFSAERAGIHLERYGRAFTYCFHNRNSGDCLAQKIEKLREQFSGKSLCHPPPNKTSEAFLYQTALARDGANTHPPFEA
jgi:hypothetical protein